STFARAHDPAAAALTQAYGRPENKEPSWPFEREMPSGKLLEDPRSATQQRLVAHRARQPVADRALAAHAQKPQIPYQPAAGAPLNTVTTTTTITAHVSPDAGLATLQNFLGGTQHSRSCQARRRNKPTAAAAQSAKKAAWCSGPNIQQRASQDHSGSYPG